MNGNPLDKYMRPSRTTSDRDAGNDAATNTLPTPVAMLDLEFANGSHAAYPYATLVKASFDPSSGITLSFAAEDVVITGHRLEELYKAITQQRTPRVKATTSNHPFAEEASGPVVTGLRCGPTPEDG